MSVFRAYDIRGIVGDELTNELAYKIGRAHVAFTKATRVVVGHDMRISSDPLKRSLCLGILDEGADVIDIGLCSTPMLYFAVAHYDNPGGIMVTASHNPAEYNGFKLTRRGAFPIGIETGMPEVENLVQQADFASRGFRGRIFKKDILPDYRTHVLKDARPPKLKVVADAANAMGALEAQFLQEIPELDIIPLHFDLDGTFPNHEANPLDPKNLVDLQEAVLEEGADIGIAFDGDADRGGFVDEKGEIITSDFASAIIASKLLRDNPGSKVLYDLRSSWAFPEHVEKHGGIPIMCKVGHAFIKPHMRSENAVFAGELSGHYYFRDHYFAENTIMAILHFFSLMKGKKASELIAPLRKYHHTGEINSHVGEPDAIINKLEKKYGDGASVTRMDGLRVETDDFWFNVRKSNTEPLLRLSVEARTNAEMTRMRDELLDHIRNH